MRSFLTRLWSDQVGSTMSAEMALVTSTTVGALFMGMGKFSQTVNEEFQNSARLAGLDGTVQVASDEEVQKKKEEDLSPEHHTVGWRFRRAEDRRTTDSQTSE